MFPELLNLFFGEHPPCANRQICQGQWALTNTNEPQHLIAKQFGNFTNLPFPTLAQHHAHPHAIVGTLNQIDPCRGGCHTIQLHTSAPITDRLRRQRRIEHYPIFLLDLVAWVGQSLG
jgi:hypothetical protein